MPGSRARALLATLFLVVLVAAACGDDSGSDVSTEPESSAPATTDTSAAASPTTATPTTAMGEMDGEMDHEEMDHEHGEGEEIPADNAPTVDFEATQINGGRLEIAILTTGFEMVDDDAEPTGAAPYAGHAHLLVNGEVAAMVYSDTYEIDLAPGENEVTVQLGTADHVPYLVDGEPIEITKLVHVPETPDGELHVHEMDEDEHTHEH